MKSYCEASDARYLVHWIWICPTPPSMIESAVLLIHVDGTAVDIMCLYVATRSRGVEKIAEPSRLTMRIVSVMNQWCDGSDSSYPMTQASLAALNALTKKYSPLPAMNPSTQARDGQLTHDAEEGRLIRFGVRWGYILQ